MKVDDSAETSEHENGVVYYGYFSVGVFACGCNLDYHSVEY